MSLGQASTSFRRGASALVTAGAILFGAAAHASDFSHDQCRAIAAVAGKVVTTLGANTLSVDFRKSLYNFVKPNGEMTCDGSKFILTPTGADVAAFNTMKDILYAPPGRINLERAGLRSVDPADLASARPATQKRSELPTHRQLAAD